MKARREGQRRIGLALAGLFVTAMFLSVLARQAEEASGDVPVIRFAHTLVYDRARDAFEASIREYEAKRKADGEPVRVEQIVVPQRMWAPWLRTQLVGGTPPDLVQQEPMSVDSLFVSRFFQPLSGELDEPNPYNRGSPADGLAWRETFYDGLEHTGFDFRLSQNFGVPLFGQTLRIAVNMDLWTDLGTVLGDDVSGHPPDDFRGFMAIMGRIERFSARTGRRMEGLAASEDSMRALFFRLHEQQTQRLALLVNGQGEFGLERPSHLLRVLSGDIEFPSPGERSAYALIRQYGRLLTPGSQSATRDDAFFRFSQGRALMVVLNSADAPALTSLVRDRFAMRVIRIPMPDADDPDFGREALGPVTERQFTSAGTFMIVRHGSGAHRARVLDFLRYLTSIPVAERLSSETGMVSATVNVEASPAVAPYLPQPDGFPPGITFGQLTDQRRILWTHLGELLKPEGGVDAFVRAVRGPMMEQFPRDLRDRRGQDIVLQMRDASMVAAHLEIAPNGREPSSWLEELIEVSLWYEWERALHESRANEILGP